MSPHFPVRFGGPVQGFEPSRYFNTKELRRMDEFMHYGVAAGIQAVQDSGIDFSKTDASRCGAVWAPASAASARSRPSTTST